MKKNGFTLIELMIVVAIIGILAAIFADAGQRVSNPAGTRCIAGFLFDARSDRQLVNEKGGGIPCNDGAAPASAVVKNPQFIQSH